MIKIKKHPKDALTPLERKVLLAQNKIPDRFPIIPYLGAINSKFATCTFGEYFHNAALMAETEIAAFNEFGHDSLFLGPNSYGISEALHSTVVYSSNKLPFIKAPYLTDYSMLDEMEAADPHYNTVLADFVEALRILTLEAGEIVDINSSMGGPFTIASNIRGTENLLRDCRKAPVSLHRLMRIVTDTCLRCIDAAAPFHPLINFSDPVASPSLISPKCYEEFVFPYTLELTSYAYQKTGKKPTMHICGNTHLIWNYLKRLELSSFSIDNQVDMKTAAEEFSGYCSIAGNIPPVDIILLGSKEQMDLSILDCIRKGRYCQTGFTLSPGCDIPFQTPLEKIHDFMEIGRKYGQVLFSDV